MKKVIFFILFILSVSNYNTEVKASETPYYCEEVSEEDLRDEDRLGDMELIAQLVQAEAGTQDLTGMRYVVDVVLNRVDSEEFPDTVEGVIFQKYQFSVIDNGSFDEAAWYISDNAFKAVQLEYEKRTNHNILYFGQEKGDYMENNFKHQDHWFGW